MGIQIGIGKSMCQVQGWPSLRSLFEREGNCFAYASSKGCHRCWLHQLTRLVGVPITVAFAIPIPCTTTALSNDHQVVLPYYLYKYVQGRAVVPLP